MRRPQTGYRPELDGLRGIAVLSVMAAHYGVPWAQNGWLGVDLFFVLSGFLITSILATEWQRFGAIDFRAFYMRRALRLFPALWLMLGVVGLFVPFEYIASTLLYVNNWAIGLEVLPLTPWLGHVWSLAIEEQFYLIWPLVLVLLLRRFSPRKVALATLVLGIACAGWRVVLIAGGVSSGRVYYGTDSHADGILLGSALGIALVFDLLPQIPRLNIVSVAAVAALLVIGLLPVMPYAMYAWYAQPVANVAGLGVILAVIRGSGLLPRLLRLRPLVFVGTISYGLYLWNVPILMLPSNSSIISSAEVKLVLTVVVVLLSYRYVERPLLRRKSRWSRADGVDEGLRRSPGLGPVTSE